MANLLESVAEGACWLRAYAHYRAWRRLSACDWSEGGVTVEDIRVHYRSFGSGPVVLLLHGGFMFDLCWAAQVPALAGAHRVVTMDSRGHGRTTLGSAGLSYRRMARDAYLLLEELGTGPAYVVGWSDGGCTALYMALLYPESVAGIALIGTSYNTGNYSERSLRLMESLLRPGSAGLLAARAAWSAAAPEPRRWGQFAGEMRRMWRNEPDLTPGDLGHVTVPALVIGCDRDEFLAWPGDPLKVFRETAQAVPRAEMRVIPGGTHTVLVRRPAELNAALLEFLDGGGAAGRIP